ncbi:MAG: hypothetical protein JSR28_04490 [Proteobacteria bacterium]|nr:hypothetical protein [Pseudomonadota bacterium]
MERIPWTEFVNRWMWLRPILAIMLAAAALWIFGLSWWSALLAAPLLVCLALIAWCAIQDIRDIRRARRDYSH